MRWQVGLCLSLALAGASGCVGDIGGDDPGAAVGDTAEEVVPAPASIARLTQAELANSWQALFGAPLPIPKDLPADDQLYGFTSISAAGTTISPVDLEKYEAATYAVLDVVWKDAPRREKLVACKPAAMTDACVTKYLGSIGRRAWRRSLSAAEVKSLVDLGANVATDLGDVWEGLRFATAAILESPNFLFRVDIGKPDPATGKYRYTSLEMASRLAFLITDAPPDEALLKAGEAGELDDPAAVRLHAMKLLDDPRARPAMVRFFRDFMGIDLLDQIDKSPDLFPAFTPSLGRSMRLEMEKLFESTVFEQGSDFRDLFTTRKTFVNGELARVYGLKGVESVDFVAVTLPDDGKRAGLLTTPGFLAMNAHKTATSPTHRGRFVRMGLLCQDIPPPPPGVNTSLPDADPNKPTTLRQRLEAHRKNPTCASCHSRMDPIGFGLENFDALGQWRDKDDGLPVDAKTDLDGTPFEGGVQLGELVAKLPDVGACVARRFYQHATEHLDKPGEKPAVDRLVQDFATNDYDFKQLVLELVVSEGFRFAAPPATGKMP